VKLTLLGYLRDDQHPELPDPVDFVDTDWDDDEHHMTSMYLASGTVARAYQGYSSCRLCGRQNGDLEYTDGEYVWPQGLAQYLDEHAVRLPARFVAHAISKLEEIETARVDSAWWSGVGAEG